MSNLKQLFLFLTLMIATLLISSGCKEKKVCSKLESAVRTAMGTDIKDFTVYCYPTDNYGVATVARDDNNNKKIDSGEKLSGSWGMRGLKPSDLNSSEWLELKGWAEKGRGGQINLSTEEKDEVAVNLILPKMFEVIKGNATFDRSQITNIDMVIKQAYKRTLNRDSLKSRILSLPDDNTTKKAYEDNILLYIVEDVVVMDFSVSISIDQNSELATELEAEFPTGVNTKTFVDGKAQLDIKVKKESKTKYSLTSSGPLIVAVYPQHQPEDGGLSSKRNNKADIDVKALFETNP